MRFIGSLIFFATACVAIFSSCAEKEMLSYDKYEGMALKAWMEINHKDLLENYQEQGGYYVDVENLGNTTPPSRPINDTAVWVRFTFTGRDLSGNVALTRNDVVAAQQGTFTKYTHYVPYYRYAAETTQTLIEGTTLAFRNEITLGKEYAAAKGFPEKIKLYLGTKLTLYMPSSVVGDSGMEGSGGYEGQFSLNTGRPFVVTMEVTDTVYNPLQREGSSTDAFAEANGGLRPADKEDKPIIVPKVARSSSRADTTPNDPMTDGFSWRNAYDSLPQVYVNYLFKPSDKLTYDYIIDQKTGLQAKAYSSAFEPYVSINAMEEKIDEALKKRFKTDEYVGWDKLTDSVKLDGTANIWYIGRFLDGFIFDTNIDEVSKIIYGEVKSKGKVLGYTPKNGDAIQAFRIAIPDMRFGQWGAILTTSTNGYGASGRAGGTTTSGGTSNYDYNNYNGYYNDYYGGNGYYNGYYGDYYGGMYGGGMYNYGYGNNSGDQATTPTVTTISTEIEAFTPLLFEIYIEPKAK